MLLGQHFSWLSTVLNNFVEPDRISPQSGVTMLKNIVDNIEQCCPNNIVASCFQQLLIFGCVAFEVTDLSFLICD